MNPADTQMTFAALFKNAVTSHPHHEAVIDGAVRMTYSELDRRTDLIANSLRNRGVRRGERIVTLLRDGLPMIELLIATAKIGGVLTALNWRLAVAELAYIVCNVEPLLGFASPRFGDAAIGAAPGLPWTILEDEADPRLAIYDTGGEGSAKAPHSNDPWLILYTSGTTGRPKGVVHSQGGLYIGTLAYAGHRAITDRDRTLLSAPLFHVNGLSSTLTALACGACVVAAPHPLDLTGLRKILTVERCTVWNYHPTLTAPLIESLRENPVPIALRSIGLGASMHSPETLHAIRSVLGAEATFGYGQTEVGGFALHCSAEDQLAHPGAWGRPLPQLKARIVDDSGAVVPTGEAGELCLCGPSIMQTYWRDPEATAAALVDGWLLTGDVCIRSEDGLIHFVGRKKELIKSGGENVYPLEVERVLRTHPAVADCCIVGVPDSRWGEAVKAFVVLDAGGALTPREVADWCRREIAGYKRPRYVEFVAEIPRDFQRKPLRAQLSVLPVNASQATG